MNSSPGLVWTKPRRESRSTLDRASVVAAAIKILDAEGVAGLSMRRLGSELGVGATSLYWHVANKDELLDMVFDEVTGELPELAASGMSEWRADIKAAMDALRTVMLRHRWFPAMFQTRPSIGPNALKFWAGVMDVLAGAGLEGADLDNAFCMVSDYVIGTTAIHVSFDEWLAADPGAVAATRAYVRNAIQEYPTYARYVAEYVARTDSAMRRDRRYEYALNCMLDGLSAQMDASKPRKEAPDARH